MNGRSELGWIGAPVIGLAFVGAICVKFAGHSSAVCDALDLCKLYGQLGDPVLVHSQA